MYYELYIDVLFLVNFMMDYLLLLLVKRILKCSATHKNICLGSLTGSLLFCLVTAMPLEAPLLKTFLYHIVINTLMVRIGLKIREKKKLPQALLALYAGGFLLGGIFTYLRQYVRIGSLFFAVAVLSYWGAQGIWSFITCIQRIGRYQCTVTLYFRGKECSLKALIDTGNSLRDPLTDKPVCVVESRAVENFIREETKEMRKIFFHSVGTENGKIPVIQLEKMCVHKEKECWVERPVIGICKENISAGGYEMILNPDIF